MSWRHATCEEIYRYYTEEFPSYADELLSFITAKGPKQYALTLREPHPVRKSGVPDRDFIRRDTWQTNAPGNRTSAAFHDFDDVLEFIRHPAQNDPLGRSDFALVDPDLLDKPDPRPNAVYYALDHWERPWVLLIDIDAKMVARGRATRVVSDEDGSGDSEELLDATGILDADSAGYPYAFDGIDRAIGYGFEVRDIFEDDSNAEETMVVYSGQGVHVYLLDSDPVHRYGAKSREVLNDLLQGTCEIPIDPVVTADRRWVARLPYSLRADVCSVVTPIESPNFDVRLARPEVLGE